ncbi:DDE-type integrase/transposase/recombinase [Streptomyces lavendulae]|uniref:DDE-type integrase/transposase/recombinase n=1 Tax=Streptomyces lavendulae TaxID=1914 RepID=UPI003EB894F3
MCCQGVSALATRHRHRHLHPQGHQLGHRRRPATFLAAEALTAACRQRRPKGPVVFHGDRGTQYTSHTFARLADELSIRLSVGRTGVCWDNALAECG